MAYQGMIAGGHEDTVHAAQTILENGGNAFDAIVAAHFAACVCEPVLASLGGGGYLLAHPRNKKKIVYDYFVQTPQVRRNKTDLDFYPISANFGTTHQTFHIGRGSIATPGTVKGLFAIHKDLCSIPIHELVQPAIFLAKDGVTINSFQAYIVDIVKPILSASQEAKAIFCSPNSKEQLVRKGEQHKQPQLAACLEALSREGESLFYQGEIAHLISNACKNSGGHISIKDLNNYQVIKRPPLSFSYRDTKILTNPAPSSGGILIAFALKLLEEIDIKQLGYGSFEHLDTLAQIMGLTNKARLDAHFNEPGQDLTKHLLDPNYLSVYKKQVLNHAPMTRGTTHISISDKQGNMASLTTSNGEGCGQIINDTGIMLNNMLGEEDLNPDGFHRWPTNQRMTSMMAPTVAISEQGKRIVLGSGGSNRIRTAILQVLVNLIDYDMSLESAIQSPRIHFENNLLSVEHGFDQKQIKKLQHQYKNHENWDDLNLFFGGTHSVMEFNDVHQGMGDPRRGGVSIVLD